MTQEVLTSFFGWMVVLNIGLLMLGSLAMLVVKDRAASLHARLFGLDPAQVRVTFYNWLAALKVLTIVFALAPYVALRLI